MSKAGAILLLMVAVLWAAAPAFACLAPAQPHACCVQMMRHCDPATMNAGMACCQAHNDNEGDQPATGASFHMVSLAQGSLLFAVEAPMASRQVPAYSAETPPPILTAGIFILRI
jgi:hypothetical protein